MTMRGIGTIIVAIFIINVLYIFQFLFALKNSIFIMKIFRTIILFRWLFLLRRVCIASDKNQMHTSSHHHCFLLRIIFVPVIPWVSR